MARELWVVTPENIPLEFELAGLGSRCGAQLIDVLLQGAMTLALWMAGLAAGALPLGAFETLSLPVLIVGTFLIVFGYSIAFETLANGQTPGKRALGLRVLTETGFPVTFVPAAVRNLVRLADFLPVGYGAGAVCAFIHPQAKRLGDVVAGTVVVKERRPAAPGYGDAAVAPGLPDPRRALTPGEVALLRRFALRRSVLRPDDAERLAYRLLAPRQARLGLAFPAEAPPRYADWVAALVQEIDRREQAEETLSSIRPSSREAWRGAPPGHRAG